LRRTRSGFFDVEDSLSWDDLNDDEALNRCIGKMITVEHVCKLLQ
jgi:hypothetical protein